MPGSITNWIIGAGIALIIIGLIAKTGALSWFGQLPGDIRIERDGFQFYFPGGVDDSDLDRAVGTRRGCPPFLFLRGQRSSCDDRSHYG